MAETWEYGDAYERYMGRWSRLAAAQFVAWLDAPPDGRWLDVGCGSGALIESTLNLASPRGVLGIDPSPGFTNYARSRLGDGRASFAVGEARQIGAATGTFDCTVSGLVLNFVPTPEKALQEMARVTRKGGTVAVYVWDYGGRMDLLRYFFDAAVALDPSARELDEARRFSVCQPDALRSLFADAGLGDLEIREIAVSMTFHDFDDFWSPFLGGQGPAPAYVMSLLEEAREMLRQELRGRLPIGADGSIPLLARAWAVRGTA
jgi:SAM-dependent methyltransferase